MLLTTLLFSHLIGVLVVHAGYQAPSITCVCSTTHCLEHRMLTCNTTGVCFSQYLDRRDGSQPLVRGCISSKTPLLCENRRPAVARASWPILLCCNSNLCNRDVVPTPPSWYLPSGKQSSAENSEAPQPQLSSESTEGGRDRVAAQLTHSVKAPADSSGPHSHQDGQQDQKPAALEHDDSEQEEEAAHDTFPAIVSPIYITVLVLGVISLVIIGIVAAVVLRRNNKFYAEQYGALERHDDFFKDPLGSLHAEDTECACADPSHVCRHDEVPTVSLCTLGKGVTRS